jgi:hypothetical protein
MFDFSTADREIKENSDRVKDITSLVNHVISLNKCEFQKEELKFDTSLLFGEKILKSNGNVIELNEDYLLYYISLMEFYKKFNYTLNNDLVSLLSFLDTVKKFLYEKSVHGKSKFTSGLAAIALLQQHKVFQSELDTFSIAPKKPMGDSFYTFSHALSTIFPFLEYNAERILKLIRNLFISHEFDKPGIQNLNVGELNNGIILFSKAQPEKGKQLLRQLLKVNNSLNQTILIPVLIGLREADQKFSKVLKKLSEFEENQIAVICSLSTGESFSETEIIKTITIAKGIKNETKLYRQQLPRFYINLINKPALKDPKILAYCFEELASLITDSDLDIALSVLHLLTIINGREKEKSELLTALINQEHFNQDLAPNIDQTFFNFNESIHFFEFLEAYAKKWRFKSDERIFSDTVTYIREKVPEEFDRQLIEMLIHDNACIRWIGLRLFNHLSFFCGLKYFAIDILKLSPKKQFKLFTSVLSVYHEPKYAIPFLLKLTSSTNEVVKEALVSRLELLTEDYANSVTDILKSEWKEMTEEQEEIYARIEKYKIDFYNQLSQKKNIKELNPWYTQSKYFNDYLSLHGKLFARKLGESVDQNSIFKLISTTVILAKGGGWKHETKDEISQLSKFNSSMILPRSYFISPDNFDWDTKINIAEDWSKFFEGWEATI